MKRAWAAVAAAGVVAAGGCARTDGAVDDAALEAVAAGSSHDVYWVGRSFEGHVLTHAERVGPETLVVYGDCEIEDQGLLAEGGCSPPVQLQQYPITRRHPDEFDPTAPCRRMEIRGVPAAVFASTGGALEVYAGATVVVIWGETGSQQRRVAESLRPLASDESGRSDLPPPQGDVDRALGRCRSTPRDTP